MSGGAVNADGSGIDVVVKPLADGSRAVVALNRGDSAAQYSLALSGAGLDAAGCPYDVRDL
jgi:alpha-galactosidase